MLPDRISNPGPLTYESGALRIALRGPVVLQSITLLAELVMRKKMIRRSGPKKMIHFSAISCT